MDDDRAAMEQIRDGEGAGLVVLINWYQTPVFRLACRYLYSETDAADITQATFIRVWEKGATYRPKAEVRSWIFAIAANLCRDFIRRRQYRERVISPIAPVDDRSPAPEEHAGPAASLESREAMSLLESAIDALPNKLKFPFLFCVIEQHSYDECAAVTGTSRKTVETRIYRARNRLRKQLAAPTNFS